MSTELKSTNPYPLLLLPVSSCALEFGLQPMFVVAAVAVGLAGGRGGCWGGGSMEDCTCARQALIPKSNLFFVFLCMWCALIYVSLHVWVCLCT